MHRPGRLAVFAAGFVLAARARLADRVLGALVEEREAAAVRHERQRIMNELHDGAKQNVRGISMMIAACIEAQGAGDPQSTQAMLVRTLDMTQEAGRQLCELFEGSRIAPKRGAKVTAVSLRQRFRKLCSDFGIETHEKLEADLGLLSEPNLIVADKICTEAFWNAIKHSEAGVITLESGRVGRTLTVRVRDNGMGFEGGAGGFGLGLMRLRAEDAGVGLEVSSAPGAGTSVELRFET